MIIVIDEVPKAERHHARAMLPNQKLMNPAQRDMSIYSHCLVYVFKTTTEPSHAMTVTASPWW